jgi:hypothetical protein
MDEDRNQEPRKRLRSILLRPEEEEDAQPEPQPELEPETRSQTVLSRLPHSKPAAPDTPEVTARVTPQAPPPAPPPVSPPSLNQRLQEDDGPRDRGPNEMPPPRKGLKFGPPFWTVTGILSLVVNGILIAILLVLWNMLGPIQGLQGTASNIGASVLGGLYSNFEKMDSASIKTVIPVDAQIPLDISVPVQTVTQITLAETATIPNAQVVINTGGVNINSAARVTLPAGTPLMVNLNFSLPVQTTIPIHLDVPVDIPMADTELHEPFVGLQDVVRPMYCLVEPNALNLRKQAICR